MPSRNVNKPDIPDSFYHVYARGGSRQKIFLDSQDYKYFLSLFERYLSIKPKASKTGFAYPHFYKAIELTAYCLMQNHFHLLLYQIDHESMKKLMQSVMTSYSRYFNLRYKRSGPVFESRYKASLIDNDAYIQHISRYIHLNPRRWQTYRYSSLKYYLGAKSPEWLRISRVKELFDSEQEYETFVGDYADNQRFLDNLKHELADY